MVSNMLFSTTAEQTKETKEMEKKLKNQYRTAAPRLENMNYENDPPIYKEFTPIVGSSLFLSVFFFFLRERRDGGGGGLEVKIIKKRDTEPMK